jgi:hypothetical protein
MNPNPWVRPSDSWPPCGFTGNSPSIAMRRPLSSQSVASPSPQKPRASNLTASSGGAAYLSSVSASMTPPWPGLGPYAVTKAALDKLVEAWRAEHPAVGFTRVVVGDCGGGKGESASHFSVDWDSELAAEVVPVWIARKYLAGSLVEVDELVQVIDAVLRCGASASIPSVAVTPRSPA